MAELNQGRRTSPWVGPVVGIALIVLLAASCLGVALIGLTPRIAPHRARPRFSEAATNLKYAFVAERAYYAEKDSFDESIDVIGFAPERGNRYRYVLSRTGDSRLPGAPDGGPHTGVLADEAQFPGANAALPLSAIPPGLLRTVGVTGSCPVCDITIVAEGNIDTDSTVDVWSISTADRTFDGGLVPAGVPFRHVNDSDY